eukprot:6192010-Pleurochrysis_carterae.AAC.1
MSLPVSSTTTTAGSYRPRRIFLSGKYTCHLNVEACASVESVKYLYKYVYKEPDRAMVAINNTEHNYHNDEIAMYQDM